LILYKLNSSKIAPHRQMDIADLFLVKTKSYNIE